MYSLHQSDFLSHYQMIQQIIDECCKYLDGERKHFKQQSLFEQENIDYDPL